MNSKYIYTLLSFFAIAFVACEDLDTLPEGATVTTSQIEEVVENDATKSEASVNAIFTQFNTYLPNYTALGSYSSHIDFGYPSVMTFTDHNGYDLISPDIGYNWNGSDLDYTDRVYTSTNCQILWNDMYNIIYAANNVVGAISEDTEEATSQFYLGQGFAARAFSYFVLAQLYQFNYVGHESDACVPIITNENSDDAALNGAARSTVQEVYDQINSDIDKAITLLVSAEEGGATRSDKRYFNAAVAYGIRARVNLTMQNWSEAASDAESAIAASSASPASISDVSVPYFWDAGEGNWMWGAIVTDTDDQIGIISWISHMGSLNYGYCTVNEGKQINKSLYDDIPSTDVRKGWWLDENKESENLNTEQAEYIESMGFEAYTSVKFAPNENVVGTSTNANDIPFMRIEEMYLIKAEAEAMGGSTGQAVSTLESFIQTYRDPSYSCSATSAEDIQEEVFFQRRVELWGEGLNWFDIMRLNKDVDRRGAGFEAAMVFNIAAGSDILLWRIPEAEIQANPALSTGDNNPSASVPSPVADTE